MICREEYLWPYVYEFADNAVESVKQRLSLLSEAGEACELYAIHGHHANGGEVAALMAHTIGADMVMTGHKLGRNRLNHLLTTGDCYIVPEIQDKHTDDIISCRLIRSANSLESLTRCVSIIFLYLSNFSMISRHIQSSRGCRSLQH